MKEEFYAYVSVAEHPQEDDEQHDDVVAEKYPLFAADSAVVYDNATSRRGHVVTLWPLSKTVQNSNHESIRVTDLEFVYYQAAAYMAIEHFNARNNAIVPIWDLSQAECDFQLTTEIRDTQFRPFQAVQGLVQAMQTKKSKEGLLLGGASTHHSLHPPMSIVGAALSGETQTLSTVGGALELPQITGTATSAALDSNPFFARTCPTNHGDALAIMFYLQTIGVQHIGILYSRDAWGEFYNQALLAAADRYNIQVVLASPYVGNGETAIRSLAGTPLRYFMGVLSQDNWKDAVQMAYKYGIMGRPDKTWFIAELTELIGEGFELDRTADHDLAQALHGTGILLLYIPRNPVFDQLFEDFLLERDDSTTRDATTNRTMRQRFLDAHVDKHVLFEQNNFTFAKPNPSIYNYLMYDAVMALGLAACHTPGFFKSTELFQQILDTNFIGATGFVILDNTTGTRYGQSVEYQIVNIVLSEEDSTNETIRFHAHTSFVISNIYENITHVKPFIYWDNTTTPPPSLPPIHQQEYNLIPLGAMIFGWVFSAIIVLSSLLWFVWTIVNRNNYVVKASQPIFLCQVCVGTFIIGLCVIPLSMQEDQGMLESGETNPHGQHSRYNLDVACMAMPWLFFIGYVVSFSALLSKTWRLNRLLQNSQGMHRVELRPHHVLGPFLGLMIINVSLLLAWTLVSPLRYHRVTAEGGNVDSFGRPTESFGTCRPIDASGGRSLLFFMLPLAVVDTIGVCFAVYQLYLARNLPSEFSEAHQLFVALISLLETVLLGTPLLIIYTDHPTARFVVTVSLINIAALCILLPTLIPKFKQRHMKPRGARAGPLNAARRNTTIRDTAQEDQGLTSSYQHIVRR